MADSLISIIIPTFDRAHIIHETLESVITQTYKNWECIIVDDGSTDHTLKVFKEFSFKDSRFKFYSRPKHKKKGPSSCRNYGLDKAEGNYILFLDSDDLLAKDCLERRFRYASENAKYDFWIFKTKAFADFPGDNKITFNQAMEVYDDAHYLTEFLSGRFPYCILGPLWTKNGLLKLGGFDERLVIFEDPDLHIRAYSLGLKSITSTESLPDSFYRIAGVNKFVISKKKLDQKFDSASIYFSKFLKKYPLQIRKASMQFFKDSILQNADFLLNFKYYFRFAKSGFFNLKQIILVPFAILLKETGLSDIKGIGLYKFKKFIFR
ncbi:MAG TPA: glycosyltransferase family A protein [Flavobacterium sp.]|nr:glycosyltransferase family A protein [Flavobacterium sp.]